MRYAIIVCVVLVLCPRDRITENLDKGVKRGKVKGVWCVSHSAHYHKTLLTHSSTALHFRLCAQTVFIRSRRQRQVKQKVVACTPTSSYPLQLYEADKVVEAT